MDNYSSFAVFIRQMKQIKQYNKSIMYFAYIFGGSFSSIATVVANFFSKMIVDCFTNNSQIDNLIKIVVILTVVVVVSFAFNLFFKAVIETDALMMRNNQFIVCANLYNDVDYQNMCGRYHFGFNESNISKQNPNRIWSIRRWWKRISTCLYRIICYYWRFVSDIGFFDYSMCKLSFNINCCDYFINPVNNFQQPLW